MENKMTDENKTVITKSLKRGKPKNNGISNSWKGKIVTNANFPNRATGGRTEIKFEFKCLSDLLNHYKQK